jgi:endonuclease-3
MPAPAALPDPRLHDLAMEVHARLCREHGCPIGYFQSLGPLEELVSSFLNHRTRNRDAKAAYERLRAALPTWERVRDAPVDEVERLIAGVRWPESKAPRLQEILREIAVRRGTLSLDFLAEMPVAEARAWLEGITGIGPKTSAAVLSFSRLRRAALPVDSHHHRVAQPLGLIPPRMAVGPSHAALAALLPPDWDAQQVYDHHEVMMLHGQKVCHWRSPACARCALLDLCPEGRSRMTPGPDLRATEPDGRGNRDAASGR